MIVFAFVLGNLCFSGLGVLLSSPGGKAPANIMMLAALVRFPLIFISGIFIPVSEMTGAAKYITYCSPLTYLVDILNQSMGQAYVFDWWIDLLVLFGFMALVRGRGHRRVEGEELEGTVGGKNARKKARDKKRSDVTWHRGASYSSHS